MNIECVKDRFAKALAKAEKITGKNISLPVLSCILLEAKDSILTIKATNLDLGIEIKLPVKVISPGSVAVPGVVLNNFVSNLTNEKNISLNVVDGNLKIKTNHSQSTIKSFPVDDFPGIPKLNSESTFTLNTSELLKGFKYVSYSASNSIIRPVLSSIFVYSDDDFINYVATDSFRLAEKKIKVKKHKDFNQVLIPLRNVPEIIRTFDDIKDDLTVLLNQNQIAFVYEDIYLTSRVIDGSFPDYKQLIIKDVKTEVVVLKQDIVNALKISNIFSDKFSQVVFDISKTNKKFTISTKNLDIGENNQEVEAVIKGEDLTVSFNYKYIVDCFNSIESDSVTLSFQDKNHPMLISGVGDKSFLYLVMPMNK
jgi:DNA polymerase-3 subunit beta